MTTDSHRIQWRHFCRAEPNPPIGHLVRRSELARGFDDIRLSPIVVS